MVIENDLLRMKAGRVRRGQVGGKSLMYIGVPLAFAPKIHAPGPNTSAVLHRLRGGGPAPDRRPDMLTS
jgi:hypothetical protein